MNLAEAWKLCHLLDEAADAATARVIGFASILTFCTPCRVRNHGDCEGCDCTHERAS